jgi:hypothetical protein
MQTEQGGTALPQETVDALQQALSAEHAAVWAYGLVSAFLPDSYDKGVGKGMSAHRDRRDATERLLAAAAVIPISPEPAYTTPKPVTDKESAVTVLVVAEGDATVAWRAVLDRADDPGVRQAALDSLTEAAVRGTLWRQDAGTEPAAVAMPGQPPA